MPAGVQLLVATFAFVVASGTPATKPQTIHWTIDGAEREAIVFAPRSSHALPVVFVFHPHGGSAEGSVHAMHFQDDWPQAIVVYPQGLNTPTPRDPGGTQSGWQREPGESQDRDVKFFDAMMTTLRMKYSVDSHRVYAAGFSNGATFTFLLWAERPNVIRGAAICAGVLLPTVTLHEPRPVIHIAGRADVVAKFALQQKSIEAEHALNDPAGVAVRSEIHDGGHVYPDFATRRIVEFFSHLPAAANASAPSPAPSSESSRHARSGAAL
jgi:polyhydroxybutyrate depolymerase